MEILAAHLTKLRELNKTLEAFKREGDPFARRLRKYKVSLMDIEPNLERDLIESPAFA